MMVILVGSIVIVRVGRVRIRVAGDGDGWG